MAGSVEAYAVGVADMRKAAQFYERVFGYSRGIEDEHFIELTGPCVRIFVCEHPVVKPVFRVLVDSLERAEAYLCAEGFERVENEDAQFTMQDPFGYRYRLIEA